ncbi:hypothetical protein BGW39_005698 [Mortierella sp. 14UC]|nr:hypothetical protein BGW39_005698 [Mortierella sp. 14UC]
MFPSSGFGGGGGFGGQQQQNTGFGAAGNAFGGGGPSAFGAPATGFGGAATTGFGGAAQTTGFGAAPAAGGFGAAPANTGFGGGGFGGSTSGFGAQAQAQPQTGFGGSTFGAAPTTTAGGFGGFGAAPATTGGFGAAGGFGAKPAATGFGAQPAAGFGAAANTGFGGGATNAFGGGAGMMGGGLNANQAGNGTANPPFSPFIEKDLSSGQNSHYQSITAMPAYRNFSFEELRLQDYQQGRKFPGQAGGFGATATGFGQQQQPAAGGFGAATTSFGGGAAPNALGGFGAGATGFGGTANTGFGGTTAFGGAPAATTAFGAAATPATGFGATSTAFGAQPATAFGAAQPATGFGATGAFGAAAKPATTGFGGFGAPATSQPATGFGATGAFGAANTTPSLFGTASGAPSAFGAPAPTAATGFGGFGATATSAAPAATGLGFGLGGASAFGATKPATTSLFGAPASSAAAAPAFGGFGAAPAASSGGGLFGGASAGSSLFPASSAATTGGLFGGGATAAPAFGAAPASSGMFGAKPATGGLFGAPATSSPFGAAPAFGAPGTTQTSSLFGGAPAAPNPFGASTLGGGFLGSSINSQAAQPAMVASVSGNIYGDNPLFQRDTSTAAAKTQPAVLSRPEPAQKLPALVPPVRFSPRQTQVRLRPTSTATFSSSVSGGDSTASRKSLLLLDGINDDSAFSSEDYTPRRSVKKLQLKPRNSEGEFNSSQQFDSQRSGATFNSQLEERAADSLTRNRSLNGGRVVDNQSPLISSQSQTTSVRHETAAAPSHASGSKVDGEYWMSPSLEELRKMTPSELAKVKDFKVGVPGVGSVSFLEPVDLTTVPSLTAICGHIVQFSHKICVVYPEDQNKPARGEGLNVPALISLERCWPVDRATRDPMIVDKNSPAFAAHVKRLKRQAETEFLDFTADNGTWTFKVRHFSKYGLSDDEEDDEVKPVQSQTGHHGISKTSAAAIAGATTAAAIAAAAAYRAYGSSDNEPSPSTPRHPEAMDIEQDESSGSENFFRRSSLSRPSKSSDPQRQNVMRTSLFGDSDARQMKRASVWSNSSESPEQVDAKAEHADGLGAEVRPSFQQDYIYETPVSHPPRKFTRSLYEQSLLSRKGNLLADAGLMMGRCCRVGWAPNGIMAVSGTICGFEAIKEREDRSEAKETINSQVISPSVVQISKLKVVAAAKEVEIERHTKSLNAVLRNTTITLDQNNEPKANIVEGTSFTTMMNSLKEQDHNLSTEEVYAWILGQSLFDNQPTPANIVEMPKAAQESYEAIGRRVRCGNWLSHVIKPALETDLQRLERYQGQGVTGDSIFTLLANNKRQKAVVAAIQAKDLRLATLLSQSGRGSRPLSGVEDQLALYKKAGVESSIPEDYLKVYALLCGALTVNVSPKDEPRRFVTDGLDWRRTFGLHLWYSNTPGVNLAEAVNAYVLSMAENPAVAKPVPWYQRNKENQDPEHYDILFQLMALLTIPSKSLEDALHPLGISPASLDYRLSWIFYMVLTQSLHISGFRSASSHSKICEDFMFQLENLGLWEWAVFVALHLETASAREAAVRQVLERHVRLDYCEATETEEAIEERKKVEFVIQSLLIPEGWVWAAKANRAKYEGSRAQEVYGLLRGGEVQRGHNLIVSFLAPEYVLNQNLKGLSDLLAMVDQSKVAGWRNGGEIYQKYLDCCSGFEGTVSRLRLTSKVTYSNDLVPAEDIKALQEEVGVLLERLPLLLKHEGTEAHPSLGACVTEMASKCTHLLRDLNDLSIQQTSSFTELPLSEDQRMNTIQQFSSDHFNDFLKSAEMSAY